MAIPAQTNKSVGTIPLPESSSCFPNSSFNAAISTALASVNTSGGAVTINFSSDTFFHTADGAIWDDTQQCWVPIDKTRLNEGSQRNQY